MCHIRFSNEPETTQCLPPGAFFYHYSIGKELVGKPMIIIARSPLDGHEGRMNGFYYKTKLSSESTGETDSNLVEFLKKEGFGPLERKFSIGQEVILSDFGLRLYTGALEEIDLHNATGKPT